jgi:ParB family chromosome partitioning protein
MPDQVRRIPLDAIDPAALARDRAGLEPEALGELTRSILASGLRMPIEVFALAVPEGPVEWGLISGFRRLAAVRTLRDDWGVPGHDAIDAFVRAPADLPAAMAAMVEENAVRAEVSPWEQALVAVAARDRGVFPTVEAAVDGLYPALGVDKRRRLRAVAHLAEELDGSLAAPETLSLRQLLRLAAAASRGYADLMRHALSESKSREPEHQWRTLLVPILAECEDPSIPDPRPGAGAGDRPRRLLTLRRRGLRIRRERTREGWSLHFTGQDATGMLIDDVFSEIERMFSPA